MSNNVQCLAKAIYFEARGEGKKGMRAVAEVIINRTKSKEFPSSACAVLYQPGQFTFMKNQVIKDKQAYKECENIARSFLNGNVTNHTKGAKYFHHRAVRPAWASKRKATAHIGSHVFRA